MVDRWRSFDVTNGRPAGEHHIRLAIGADYLDASPVRGVRRGGGEERMMHARGRRHSWPENDQVMPARNLDS